MLPFLAALLIVGLRDAPAIAAPLPDASVSMANAFVPAAPSLVPLSPDPPVLETTTTTTSAVQAPRRHAYKLVMAQAGTKVTTGGTKCTGGGPFITAGKYHSQSGEDEYLDNNVFHQKKDAVFLDIGCNDGITGSNSYYFEKTLGWTGKCVEADPKTFEKINSKAGRSSGLQIALSDKAGEVEFTKVSVGGDTGLSGISNTLDNSFASKVGNTETFKVKSITPTMLLEEHYANKKVIDYLSIDIEGAEMGVIRNFPFNKWCVNAISVEDNDFCADTSFLPELKHILEPLGFEYRKLINVDQMFVRKEQCQSTTVNPVESKKVALLDTPRKMSAEKETVKQPEEKVKLVEKVVAQPKAVTADPVKKRLTA